MLPARLLLHPPLPASRMALPMTMATPSSLLHSPSSSPLRFDRLPRKRNGDSSTTIAMMCALDATTDNHNLEALKIARHKFIHEVSFKSNHNHLSLAKTLLYIAAEDEAFMAFNRDIDKRSYMCERKDKPAMDSESEFEPGASEVCLVGKTISAWLKELDVIAREVEAELVSRDIGCHLLEVLEAINVILFQTRGFKRSPVPVHPKFSYLHTALSSRCGSAIMLSVIYMEICQRLGITVMGSRVGEDFLIWPQTGYPEELFKAASGKSLFSIVNGRCVDDPKSKASDLTSKSLFTLDIATNRDIIGIALANLIRLYWKRASKINPGLMLSSPLRTVYTGNDKASMMESSEIPLLRPQDLRLAVMASERLLILQPGNWALRRDHGMLLYYSRKYKEAVQELSICMAFAPAEEAEILEPFVEKLHLLCLESSWRSLGPIAVPPWA